MNEQSTGRKPIYNSPHEGIEGFDSLAELALDLHWSWNHATDEVWRQLDPALWEFTQNPWVVLQTVSKDKLKSVLADFHGRQPGHGSRHPHGRRIDDCALGFPCAWVRYDQLK